MVAPPLVADVYEVSTIGELNGMPCDHVIHYLVTAVAGEYGVVVDTLATTDAVAWMEHQAAQLPPYYSHISSVAKYLGDTITPDHAATGGGAGTSAFAFGSHATCATYRHTVPGRGRGRDGRTNMPGPPAPAIEQPAGSIYPSTRADYEAAWTAYQAQLSDALFVATGHRPQLVVLNKKLGTYRIPSQTSLDVYPNTHRRWQKRLARHRTHH